MQGPRCQRVSRPKYVTAPRACASPLVHHRQAPEHAIDLEDEGPVEQVRKSTIEARLEIHLPLLKSTVLFGDESFQVAESSRR